MLRKNIKSDQNYHKFRTSEFLSKTIYLPKIKTSYKFRKMEEMIVRML